MRPATTASTPSNAMWPDPSRHPPRPTTQRRAGTRAAHAATGPSPCPGTPGPSAPESRSSIQHEPVQRLAARRHRHRHARRRPGGGGHDLRVVRGARGEEALPARRRERLGQPRHRVRPRHRARRGLRRRPGGRRRPRRLHGPAQGRPRLRRGARQDGCRGPRRQRTGLRRARGRTGPRGVRRRARASAPWARSHAGPRPDRNPDDPDSPRASAPPRPLGPPNCGCAWSTASSCPSPSWRSP